MHSSEANPLFLFFFLFFFTDRPPGPIVFHYFICTVFTMRSAAPQISLWGGPSPGCDTNPGQSVSRQGHGNATLHGYHIAYQSEWRWSRVRIPALRAYRVHRHTTPENLANDVWVLLKIIFFITFSGLFCGLNFRSGFVLPSQVLGIWTFFYNDSGRDFSKCETKMPFVSKNF